MPLLTLDNLPYIITLNGDTRTGQPRNPTRRHKSPPHTTSLVPVVRDLETKLGRGVTAMEVAGVTGRSKTDTVRRLKLLAADYTLSTWQDRRGRRLRYYGYRYTR